MIQILLFVCFLSTWAYDESREQTSDDRARPPAVLNKSTIKTSSFIHQIINEMSRTNSARQYNHLLYRNTECTSLASYAAPQKTMHKIS